MIASLNGSLNGREWSLKISDHCTIFWAQIPAREQTQINFGQGRAGLFFSEYKEHNL